MAELNPPGFLQNRADHPARALRGMIGALVPSAGIIGTGDWAVSQRGAGANMSVDIAGGQGFIAGTEDVNQSFYHCLSDTTVVNKTVAAAHATLNRTDLVIARVYDSQYSGATNLWTFEVVTGTPGAGTPAAPALPANSFSLATIYIAAAVTSVLTANITNTRVQISSPVATQTNAAAVKATPVDADVMPILDSANSFGLRKITWANIKTALKTYFDTLYTSGAGYAPLASPTFTGTVTVPTPTNATDAVTKAYADAVTQGLDIKDSVRVASTANIAIASALINASTIDGVVVATGDRVLLKNQTAGAENGIYVVVASGAASRSTDSNTSAKVTSGMYVFVSEGTASADMGYVLTTNDPITLDTTSLTFTQFSGAGQITAGTGLSKSGNTLSIDTAVTADLTTAQTLSGKTAGAGIIAVGAAQVGYMGIPKNATTTGAYTITAADNGKVIYCTANRTITIDSNANLPLGNGFAFNVVAASGVTVTIVITTDTMNLAGTGTTGSRTLAQFGIATFLKLDTTLWLASGNGLT